MFKNFNDFLNQFFKFSIFMLLFVMGLWLFPCVQKAIGADDLPAPKLTLEMDEEVDELPAQGVRLTTISPMAIGESEAVGKRSFGFTPPQIDEVTLKDGLLYVTYRQFPMFSYADKRPPDHVYREVYRADFEGTWIEIKLWKIENALVTPPSEIPEKVEW
jgi:hypothetical protein